MTPDRLPDLPGFTLQQKLGSGGSADVYLSQQHMPERRVAVKWFHEALSDADSRARFAAEANLLAGLSSHPAIVTIHETGTSPAGHPYLVMEYCSKPDLAERLLTRPLTVPELLQTLIRLAGAVETAHRAGVIHRDIKPANVLTTDYGWPALADFGISHAVGEEDDATALMSLPWVAPEVLSGAAIDFRADVYGLGATAYTLLAGHSPFEGDAPDLEELMRRVLQSEARPIPRNDLPESLQRLLLMTLEKDPARRPQSVSEFARSLQRIEQSLHLPMTHFDIPTGLTDSDIGDAETTSLRRPEPVEQSESAGQPDIDEATRLVNRRASPELHGHDAEPDEATRLVNRGAVLEPAGASTGEPGAQTDAGGDDSTILIERTRLVNRARSGALPGDLEPHQNEETYGGEDETVLISRNTNARGPVPDSGSTGGPGDDATVLARRDSAKTPQPSETVIASSTTRIAYDPEAQGVSQATYRTRGGPVQVPERARQGVQPPAQRESAEQELHRARAAARERRRSFRRKLVVLGVVGTVVLAGLVTGLIVLVNVTSDLGTE